MRKIRRWWRLRDGAEAGEVVVRVVEVGVVDAGAVARAVAGALDCALDGACGATCGATCVVVLIGTKSVSDNDMVLLGVLVWVANGRVWG